MSEWEVDTGSTGQIVRDVIGSRSSLNVSGLDVGENLLSSRKNINRCPKSNCARSHRGMRWRSPIYKITLSNNVTRPCFRLFFFWSLKNRTVVNQQRTGENEREKSHKEKTKIQPRPRNTHRTQNTKEDKLSRVTNKKEDNHRQKINTNRSGEKSNQSVSTNDAKVRRHKREGQQKQ